MYVVPDWLMTLAASGGSALVGAVATSAWETARSGIAGLFRRTGARRAELAGQWADETAVAMGQAPADQLAAARDRLAQAWQQRLIDLVQECPEVVDELRSWVEQTKRKLPAPQQGWVNTFVARDHATQYNAPGGSIVVNNSDSGTAD